MTLDDIKHFTEVENSSSVNARNNDINFAANMPKLVTTNATNLHEWHKGFPKDVYTMSNDDRLNLKRDVKAVNETCCHLSHHRAFDGLGGKARCEKASQ